MLIIEGLVVICVISFCFASGQDPLLQLKNFEILSRKDLKLLEYEKKVVITVTLFRRLVTLHLYAECNPNVLDMLGIKISHNDEMYRNRIKLPRLYKGQLAGDNSSSVFCQIGYNNAVSLTISTTEEVIIVEPLSLLSYYKNRTEFLTYRLGDLYDDIVSGSKHDMRTFNLSMNLLKTNNENYHKRRDLPEANRLCGLQFFADYYFFSNVGAGDLTKTVDIIVKMYSRVNEIFSSTEFFTSNGSMVTGFGFYLRGNFSFMVDGRACLHHLLTFSPDPDGALGLSWMANPQRDYNGGICARPFLYKAKHFATNTGYTSYANSKGVQLLNGVAELITAHELGHSWGADHDPETSECTPSAEEGGRHLMYTYAVSGYAVNNYRFSPCSRRAISRVLAAKAGLCFKKEAAAKLENCGNHRLDIGEECDSGTANSTNCCTSQCKLKEGAVCSPANHACCSEDCQLAHPNTVCAEASEKTPCLLRGFCDGKSPFCQGPLPSSTRRCQEHGFCKDGICIPFCHHFGYQTCICSELEFTCSICCSFKLTIQGRLRTRCKAMAISELVAPKDPFIGMFMRVDDSAWKPINLTFWTENNTEMSSSVYFLDNVNGDTNQTHIHHNLVQMQLQDNRPCSSGVCEAGICILSRAKRISRQWPLFQYITRNKISTLIWDNIVAFIITITVLVWTPLSILISVYDDQFKKLYSTLRRRIAQDKEVDILNNIHQDQPSE